MPTDTRRLIALRDFTFHAQKEGAPIAFLLLVFLLDAGMREEATRYAKELASASGKPDEWEGLFGLAMLGRIILTKPKSKQK